MAVVHEHDDGDGSSAAVVAIFLIALIVILAILFYGFAVAHWFGVGVNVTQVEHLAHRLRPVVDETIVAGGSASLELAGVRRIEDRQPGMGPLAGMHAGFLAARHSLVWVVACDLPDVEPALGALMRNVAQD